MTLNIANKRILKSIVFGFTCVGCGFIATTILPTSSLLLHAGIAGVVSGLAAVILLKVPWFRDR
jgi:hypothetical protein